MVPMVKLEGDTKQINSGKKQHVVAANVSYWGNNLRRIESIKVVSCADT